MVGKAHQRIIREKKSQETPHDLFGNYWVNINTDIDNGIVTYEEYKGQKGKPKTTFYHINDSAKRLIKQQLLLQEGNTTGRVFYATADQFETHFSKFFRKNNLKITLKGGTLSDFQLYDFFF